MARNPYISQTVRSEQDLYEAIVIESIKVYGQDVEYIPRELVNEDRIFGEDGVSRFDDAYSIEMYMENFDGFEGDQELFSKFGVEIRDRATLHVSRRVWDRIVGWNESFNRPREGDLIYLPLSTQLFEIMRVVDDKPFYQISNLPTYRLEIELFEYSDEDFDTGVEEIDNTEVLGNRILLTLLDSGSDALEINENIEQYIDSANGIRLVGEIVDWNASTNILEVAHIGSTDGQFREFSTGSITSVDTNITKTITAVGEQLNQTDNQSADFEDVGDNVIDFSESNPFGEVT